MYSRNEAQSRRDRKVRAAMGHIGPIWLLNDEYRPQEESCLFDLVYPNSVDGWVQSRYKYDAFNDVLYHMGERRLTEAETLIIQENESYLGGEVATAVPNQPRPRM
jgi:hypothetical protein